MNLFRESRFVTMRELRRVFIAMGYFTRLPVPGWVGFSADDLNRAARYFPLIGVLVGAVAAMTLWSASQLLPASLAVILSMLAGVLLTGAFHEDGLADAADGFGGGHTPERVLEIMRDSRIGSFGAIALLLCVLGKFSALCEMMNRDSTMVIAALLIAHAASRGCALAVMALLPYVRVEADAKAQPVAEGIGRTEWLCGGLIAAAPLIFAYLSECISLAVLGSCVMTAVLSTALCARYFHRRIGGYTGDCLGATQQVSEFAIYFALLAGFAG